MSDIQTLLQPRLVIDRVDDAISFYQAAFGAERIERYADAQGVVVHAAVRIGTSTFSIAQEVKDWQLLGPTAVGGSPVLLHLTLPDPDAACSRAVERGAAVVIPIKDRPYGRREGRIRDPFGHLWVLSRPTGSVSPAELQRLFTNS